MRVRSPRCSLILATQVILRFAVTTSFGFTAFTHTQMTATIESAPETPFTTPSWGYAEMLNLPHCAPKVEGIPSRVVVKTRTSRAWTLPYTDATIANIIRTWDDNEGADDLFTIGACN